MLLLPGVKNPIRTRERRVQEVTARSFMPLNECPSRRCAVNKARGQLNLQARGSKFAKFQEVLAPKYVYPDTG